MSKIKLTYFDFNRKCYDLAVERCFRFYEAVFCTLFPFSGTPEVASGSTDWT